MKLWHRVVLTIGILMLIGGLLALILPIDNPKYAPGEACAMVERVYHWRENSGHLYSDLYEEYLGKGIWEVKSGGIYTILGFNDRAIFRVYEATDTVEIVNTVARVVLEQKDREEAIKSVPVQPTAPSGFITEEMIQEALGK